MPDDNLLSHWLQHYHRHDIFSRSCSGWEGVVPTRYGHQAELVGWPSSTSNPIRKSARILRQSLSFGNASFTCQGYRDKPHEQLVLVSLTHCCASTPSLSTSWSRTTLQGDLVSGKSYLEASFPLRCFQRLSFPNLATRLCHWRDNRYTRGSSTPVLSY